MRANSRHNFGLDLLRAGAIVAVLFSHTADWFLGPGRATDIRAAYVGGAGVEAFFSLSGFLIGGILLRALDRGLTLPRLGQFWSRRWLRTLPAYWVLILGLDWWFGGHDWRSLVFLQSFVPKTEWAPLTPHTWSLVLEEWFYLLVPPLVVLASRLVPVRWAVPAVCAGLFAGCMVLRGWAVMQPDPAFWGDDLSINPFLRLDCAAWGLLAAWIVWVRRGRWPGLGAACALLGVGVVLLAALGVVFELSFTPERLAPVGFGHWAVAWAAGRTSAIEFAAMCVLLGLGAVWPAARGAGARAVGAVAAFSYALYLVHVPVIYMSRHYGLDDRASWAVRGEIAGLVVAAAVALRLGVELPVLALRDRFVPDRGRLPAPAAGAGD